MSFLSIRVARQFHKLKTVMKRKGHTTSRKNGYRSATNDLVKNASLFFSAVQPKLAINQPNDDYEKEADVAADKVMNNSPHPVESTSYSNVFVQRKCAACEEEEKNIQ